MNGAIPSIFDQEPHLSQPDHDQNVTKYAMTEKRYCKIKWCQHEVGTNDKDILFVR